MRFNLYLYTLNFALLLAHEIDSAYWKEWELFHIPGGIQVFLILNFLFILIALSGYTQVLRGKRSGVYFSLLLAGAGIFAFAVHSYFILAGLPQFTLPVSLLLLGLILVVSLAQGFLAMREILYWSDAY